MWVPVMKQARDFMSFSNSYVWDDGFLLKLDVTDENAVIATMSAPIFRGHKTYSRKTAAANLRKGRLYSEGDSRRISLIFADVKMTKCEVESKHMDALELMIDEFDFELAGKRCKLHISAETLELDFSFGEFDLTENDV
jgi:hypothetical protein